MFFIFEDLFLFILQEKVHLSIILTEYIFLNLFF
jgi:hypothetical protein